MFRQAYNRSTASGYNKAEIRLQNNETNALTMGLKNWQENALFLKVSTIKKQLKLDADVKIGQEVHIYAYLQRLSTW